MEHPKCYDTLAVGTTIVELTEVNGSITIDSEKLECYKGVTGCNAQMSGDFPVLVSGSNAISWIGSVSRVVIQPNWRYFGDIFNSCHLEKT